MRRDTLFAHPDARGREEGGRKGGRKEEAESRSGQGRLPHGVAATNHEKEGEGGEREEGKGGGGKGSGSEGSEKGAKKI